MIDCKWSSNFVYGIGLIASDGCLSKDRRHIDFTSKDKEQVINFTKVFNLGVRIGNKKIKDKIYYRVQFGDVNFYNFLLNIGLSSKKSKIISSLTIPDVYFFDFLRGCFDGDGYSYSYWDKRWKSSFMFYLGFVSASEKFLKWISNTLIRLLGISGIIRNENNKIYSLKFAKENSILLLKKIYGSSDIICLSRKRFKIVQSLDIISNQAGMS